MLFIILTKLNSSSNVGVTEEINFIETVTLKQFNGNIHDLFDNLELTFNKIQDLTEREEMTEKSFLRNIFCALLTTTNPTFHRYIETKKDTFDK
eukprot:11457-Ditylum_brightwellii.AAC.1